MFRRRPRGAPPAPAPAPAPFADDRLDPVRWRRPGRTGLFRLAAVAALLATAAAAVYAREPAGCPPSALPAPGPAAPGPAAHGPAAHGPPAASAAPSAPASLLAAPTSASAGDRLRAVPRGSVGVPVRLADPAALGVLRPGDRVDLVAASGDGEAAKVASNALVLSVGHADEPGAGLFLALTSKEAGRAAAVPGDTRFSVLVRPPA